MNNEFEQLSLQLAKTPENITLLMRRAVSFFEMFDYNNSIKDCLSILALDNSNSEALALMSRNYIRIDKYQEALDTAEKAILFDENCSLAYLSRGWAIYELNANTKEALYNLNHAIELDPLSSIAYNSRGIFYANTGDYDAALSDYNKSIEINPRDSIAYNNRANLYATALCRPENALDDYKKAIQVNPNDADPYNNRALLYSETLNQFENAKLDFDTAIQLDKTNPTYLYNRARFFALKLFNFHSAIEDINTAIEMNPSNADFLLLRGEILSSQNLNQEALNDFNKARKLSEGHSNYNLRLIDGRIEELCSILSIANEANKRIKLLMDKIDSAGIEKSLNSTNSKFKKFLVESNDHDSERMFIFEVLRRWNSYTPIISDKNRISKGGGYFIKLSSQGIVIDPGFNFIDNFIAQGHKFNEIDHVIISHAHNDHTIDLESILTILNRYNREILGSFDVTELGNQQIGNNSCFNKSITQEVLDEQKTIITDNDRNRIESIAMARFLLSPRRKKIKLFMTSSTFKKYATILKLNSNEEYEVIIIKAGDTLPISLKATDSNTRRIRFKITTIFAHHNDIISDNDSVGLIVEFNKTVLIYTGDTRYDKNIEKQYENLYKKYKEHDTILLAHIGGFKSIEKKFDYSKNTTSNLKFFYPNHLGRLGLAKLIEVLKPKICIISEFGEEFRKDRIELTEIYQEVYKNTFFIPADIGLSLDENLMTKLVDDINDDNKLHYSFSNYSLLAVCEKLADASLHFYNKECVSEKDLLEALQ